MSKNNGWELAAAQTKSGSILWCYQLNFHQIGHTDPYLSQFKESDITCPLCQEKLTGEANGLYAHQEKIAKKFDKNALKEKIEKTYLKPEDQKRIPLTKLIHPHNNYCPTEKWGIPLQTLYFGHLVEEPIHLSNASNELGAEEALMSTLGKNRKRVAPNLKIDGNTVSLEFKDKVLVQYTLMEDDHLASLSILSGAFAAADEFPIFTVNPKKLASDVHTWPVQTLNDAARKLPWRTVQTMREHLKGIKNDEKDQLQKRLSQIPQNLIWEKFKQNLGYEEGAVERWWFHGVGDPRAETWILGLYPSNEEMRFKRIYAGKTGILLNQVIEEAVASDPTLKFTNGSVYLDNIIKSFRPGKSKISAYDKAEQFWLLKRQLAFFQPKRVICLGAEAWKAIAGDKLGAAKYRGNWLDVEIDIQKEIDAGIDRVDDPDCPTIWKGQVSNSWSPAYILRPEGADNMPIFRQQMVNLFLGKEKMKIEFPWAEFKTNPEVRAWVDSIVSRAKKENLYYDLTIDTEGQGLPADVDEFDCLQFSVRWFDKNDKRTADPIETTVWLFNEKPDTEIHLWKDYAQADWDLQMSLFDLGSSETATEDETEGVEEEYERVVRLANNDAERQEILRKRPKNKDLVLFVPYLEKKHLLTSDQELRKCLSGFVLGPRCRGHVLTNVNYDRIRMTHQLEIDLGENLRGFVPYDTMFGEHALNESNEFGLKESLERELGWPRHDQEIDVFIVENDLATLCKKCNIPKRGNKYSLIPWSKMRYYSAADTFGAASLADNQHERLLKETAEKQQDQPNHTVFQAVNISCKAMNGIYELQSKGMPIGQKGINILKTLTEFYQGHRARMEKQFTDAVYELTGFRDANLASSDELCYILYSEKGLGRYGITPWKEAGRKGRLWDEIPRDERANSRGSVDAESLEILASNCQEDKCQKLLMLITEAKSILTICNLFLPPINEAKSKGTGIYGYINERTLCLHSEYSPRLETGRCRSADPNLATWLKAEKEWVTKILGVEPPHALREICQAPDGFVLLNRDYKTAEVLTLAYLSDDPVMLSIIEQGLDFHCRIARAAYPQINQGLELYEAGGNYPTDWINANFATDALKAKFKEYWDTRWGSPGKPPEKEPKPLKPKEIDKFVKTVFEAEREGAKPITFGVPYGRNEEAIMKALNRQFYVGDVRDASGAIKKIELKACAAMVNGYKSEFNVAWDYLCDQARHAKEKGWIKDTWGYVRHFPKGMNAGDRERQAYNWQIQHGVAVLMNQAMHAWTEYRKEKNLKSWAYMTLYDALGWAVSLDEIDDVWNNSMRVMTAERPVCPPDAPNPKNGHRFIPTDGKLSQGWDANTFELSKFAIKDRSAELNKTGLEKP